MLEQLIYLSGMKKRHLRQKVDIQFIKWCFLETWLTLVGADGFSVMRPLFLHYGSPSELTITLLWCLCGSWRSCHDTPTIMIPVYLVKWDVCLAKRCLVTWYLGSKACPGSQTLNSSIQISNLHFTFLCCVLVAGSSVIALERERRDSEAELRFAKGRKYQMFPDVSLLLSLLSLLLQAETAAHQMYTHVHHFSSVPFGDKSIPTSIIHFNSSLQNSELNP